MIRAADMSPEARVGAVPLDFFQPHAEVLEEQILTEDGHMLHVFRGPDLFHVFDAEERAMEFRMDYMAPAYAGLRSSVEVTVRTKIIEDSRERRASGIRAGRLVMHAMAYFDALHGSVDNFYATWPEWSDNFAQYFAALEAYGPEPSLDERKVSAFATWNGQVARAEGFQYLCDVPHMEEDIHRQPQLSAEFTRHAPQRRRRRVRPATC